MDKKWTFMDLIGEGNGYAMRAGRLKISPEMLRLIGEINEFKGSWRTLTTFAAERLSRLKRVATIESIFKTRKDKNLVAG